jgi:hypothetical protein
MTEALAQWAQDQMNVGSELAHSEWTKYFEWLRENQWRPRLDSNQQHPA